MPIYAYKCSACGHAKDVLQKLSDPQLTTCPACGAESYSKQVTAAGFQLKGAGWYVTDFRPGGDGANSGVGKPAGDASDKPASTDAAKPAEGKSEAASASAPVPAAAPAAAAPSASPSPAPAAAPKPAAVAPANA